MTTFEGHRLARSRVGSGGGDSSGNGNGLGPPAVSRDRIEGTLDQARLYDLLAARFCAALATDSVRSRAAVEVAARIARGQLQSSELLADEEGRRLTWLLLRDIDRIAAEIRLARGTVLLPRGGPRDGALACLVPVLESLGATIHAFAHRADEAIAYLTGEVTCAGTLTCSRCKATLHLEQTGTVPTCPSCGSSEFRKDFRPGGEPCSSRSAFQRADPQPPGMIRARQNRE